MQTYCSIELFDDDFEKVAFYTVRIEDEGLAETEKFYKRFLEDEMVESYSEEFQDIVTWLELIGNEFGVDDDFFRFENTAGALPPKSRVARKYMYDIPTILEFNRLRLYCIPVSESIVILLNGGIKEAQTNMEKGAEDIQPHFRLAEKIGKIITEKIVDKDLTFSFKKLEGDLSFFI